MCISATRFYLPAGSAVAAVTLATRLMTSRVTAYYRTEPIVKPL